MNGLLLLVESEDFAWLRVRVSLLDPCATEKSATTAQPRRAVQ